VSSQVTESSGQSSQVKVSTWRRVLSPTGNTGDAMFRVLMLLCCAFMVGIVVAMVFALATDSMLSIRQFGFGFLTSQHGIRSKVSLERCRLFTARWLRR
jgi:ABC-type phosphate transport system permease subunit